MQFIDENLKEVLCLILVRFFYLICFLFFFVVIVVFNLTLEIFQEIFMNLLKIDEFIVLKLSKMYLFFFFNTLY